MAFLRGINVGRAKRVSMADLRALVESLGYTDVRTHLNSGNVVFTLSKGGAADAAARIEEAMSHELGVSTRVTVLTAAEVKQAVARNPLGNVGTEPSRLHVAVLARPEDRGKLRELVKQDWKPEAFALGTRVAYLWCPAGVIKSRVANAVNRALGDDVTARNWRTMTRLVTLLLLVLLLGVGERFMRSGIVSSLPCACPSR